MNSAAIALQGVGYGPLSMALQGFLELAPSIYEKYVSTIYRQNSRDVVLKFVDSDVIYRIESSTDVFI